MEFNRLQVKANSVIDELRKRYPGAWKYNAFAHHWEGPEGHVCRVAIGFCEDDGECRSSSLVYYKKDGTPERIYGL